MGDWSGSAGRKASKLTVSSVQHHRLSLNSFAAYVPVPLLPSAHCSAEPHPEGDQSNPPLASPSAGKHFYMQEKRNHGAIEPDAWPS